MGSRAVFLVSPADLTVVSKSAVTDQMVQKQPGNVRRHLNQRLWGGGGGTPVNIYRRTGFRRRLGEVGEVSQLFKRGKD